MEPDRQRDVERIEDHYVTTWSKLGGGAGGMVIAEPDRHFTIGGLDQVPYNHVLRCNPDGEPEPVVDEILARLEGRDLVWSLTSASSPRLEGVLAERGFSPFTTLTGMIRTLDGEIPEPSLPEGCSVREVTPDLLPVHVELILDQWHLSPDDRERLLAMHHELGFTEVRRWLVFDGDTPLGKASAGFYPPGVVGIYGVATLPAARGRGIASALMSVALRAGAEAGCREAVLQSTPMAIPIYARFGFEIRCEIPIQILTRGTAHGDQLSRT